MVGIDLISSHKMLKLQHQMKKDHIIWLASPRDYITMIWFIKYMIRESEVK